MYGEQDASKWPNSGVLEKDMAVFWLIFSKAALLIALSFCSHSACIDWYCRGLANLHLMENLQTLQMRNIWISTIVFWQDQNCVVKMVSAVLQQQSTCYILPVPRSKHCYR